MSRIVKTEETYYEFVRSSKNRKRSQKSISGGHNDSHTNSGSFAGTPNFAAACDLAINGWDAGLKQLKLDDGVLVGSGMEFNPSVHGAVVNIGAYLTGQPETMFNLTEKREFNLEPLTVYALLNYPSFVDSETAMNFTKSMLEHVNYFQSKYNVKLIGVFDSVISNVRWINDVIIKDFDKRFVLNNLAFSMHPSFFRRLWFAKLEAEDFVTGGYGRSTDSYKIINEIQERRTGKEKTLVMPQVHKLNGDGSFSRDKIIEI